METLPGDFYKLTVPLRIAVIGPSMVGKSSLIYKLLKYRKLIMTESDFSRICYVYPGSDTSNMREKYIEELRQLGAEIEIHHQIPDIAVFQSSKGPTLIVLDDMMSTVVSHPSILALATMISHHSNVSLIYSMQNPYSRGVFAKTISRNLTGYFLFQNLADMGSTSTLTYQVLGKNSSDFLSQCLQWIHDNLDGERSIYISCHPNSMKIPYRVMTNLFPRERNNGDAESRIIRPIVFEKN